MNQIKSLFECNFQKVAVHEFYDRNEIHLYLGKAKKRVVLKQPFDNFSTKAAFFAAYMMLNFRDKQRALTALY